MKLPSENCYLGHFSKIMVNVWGSLFRGPKKDKETEIRLEAFQAFQEAAEETKVAVEAEGVLETLIAEGHEEKADE